MPEKTKSKPVPFCAECKHFEQSKIGIKRRISGCNYYKKLVLAGGYPCVHFERKMPLPEPPEEVQHE